MRTSYFEIYWKAIFEKSAFSVFWKTVERWSFNRPERRFRIHCETQPKSQKTRFFYYFVRSICNSPEKRIEKKTRVAHAALETCSETGWSSELSRRGRVSQAETTVCISQFRPLSRLLYPPRDQQKVAEHTPFSSESCSRGEQDEHCAISRWSKKARERVKWRNSSFSARARKLERKSVQMTWIEGENGRKSHSEQCESEKGDAFCALTL